MASFEPATTPMGKPHKGQGCLGLIGCCRGIFSYIDLSMKMSKIDKRTMNTKSSVINNLLLCSPSYFTVDYQINPWMTSEEKVDKQQAFLQWEHLQQIYRELGCSIELLDPIEGLPDMVFTANAGFIVNKNEAVVSSFLNKERQGEETYFKRWFEEKGWKVHQLDVPYEGVAESFYWQDKLLVGFGKRAHQDVPKKLEKVADREVVALQLVDDRFYHLDMSLAVPREDLLVYYPGAFSDDSVQKLRGLDAEVIELTEEDACAFGCNFITLGDNIIMNKGTQKLAPLLKERGFHVFELDMSEYRKSGGGVRCLTFKY